MLKTIKTVLHILFERRKIKQSKIKWHCSNLQFDCFNKLDLNQWFSSLGCCLGSSKIFLWMEGGVVCQSYLSFCCFIQTATSPDTVIESWSPWWHCFMWHAFFARFKGCFFGRECTASQYYLSLLPVVELLPLIPGRWR